MTRTLEVSLRDRSYPIHIGAGLLDDIAGLSGVTPGSSVAIVTNPVVADLYLARLKDALESHGCKLTVVVVPDGEEHKTIDTWSLIHDRLLAARLDRKSTVIALGGGVIGDVAGFAAATYQRGTGLVQVPTTLLSQVDSSVGGKTAVNHPAGKNMIGTFYQPRAVVIDTSTLTTLPERELRAGLAEVVKYGLIRDRAFFEWLEKNVRLLLDKDSAALIHAVEKSCRHKAEIVAIDETEQAERALLNLGHTFGHAIEAGLGFGKWLHGEAVAAGTVLAAQLSSRVSSLGNDDVDRIVKLFRAFGLPVTAPALGADRFLELMSLDKKVRSGRLRLILLRSIGDAFVADDVPLAEVRAVLM